LYDSHRLSFARLYLRNCTLAAAGVCLFHRRKGALRFQLLFSRTPPADCRPTGVFSCSHDTSGRLPLKSQVSGTWSSCTLRAGKADAAEALAFTYAVGDGGRLFISAGQLFAARDWRQCCRSVRPGHDYSCHFPSLSGVVCVRMAKRSQILVVGTGSFARRVGTSLLHGEVLPCPHYGYVRLPVRNRGGWPGIRLGSDSRLFQRERHHDIIIALPAAQLSDVQKIAAHTGKTLCSHPVRNRSGRRHYSSRRLIDLGGIHMLDLRPLWRKLVPTCSRAHLRCWLFNSDLLLTLPVTLLIALA